MSKYAVPEHIRACKPKGTMVKRIGGKYYVYTYSCVKNTEGKWKTKIGKLIGTIKEGMGFVPNDTFIENEQTTIFEYGQYYAVYSKSQNVLEDLKKYFNPLDATEIFLIALIIYINGFRGLSNVEEYFKQSYLSVKYPDISLSYHNINKLVDSLGRKQQRPLDFQKYLISKSNQMAVDGHAMMGYSKENDLTDYGNKYKETREAQYNMLTAYDIETSSPIFAKAYPGSNLDKISIKDILTTFKLKGKLLIMDCGFYSKENISLFSKENKYIIPLSKNLKQYKELKDSIDYTKSFIYSAYRKKDPIYYKENILEDQKTKIIIYKNLTINVLEQDDFKRKIGTSPVYTEEAFEQMKDYFGIIVLQTNLDETASEVYNKYKQRWQIETFFNYMKNRLDYDSTNEQDYYIIQGLTFLTIIIGLINKEFSTAVKKTNDSTKDILTRCRFVKIIKKGNDFEIGNFNKKVKTLFEQMDCELNLKIKL